MRTVHHYIRRAEPLHEQKIVHLSTRSQWCQKFARLLPCVLAWMLGPAALESASVEGSRGSAGLREAAAKMGGPWCLGRCAWEKACREAQTGRRRLHNHFSVRQRIELA